MIPETITEAVVTAALAGINPWNARAYRGGPVAYSLGEQAKAKGKQPTVRGMFYILRKKILQVLKDMYRMGRTRPEDIGGADLDDPNWIPIHDSLTENMGQIRRYASMRAYHDRGQFV